MREDSSPSGKPFEPRKSSPARQGGKRSRYAAFLAGAVGLLFMVWGSVYQAGLTPSSELEGLVPLLLWSAGGVLLVVAVLLVVLHAQGPKSGPVQGAALGAWTGSVVGMIAQFGPKGWLPEIVQPSEVVLFLAMLVLSPLLAGTFPAQILFMVLGGVVGFYLAKKRQRSSS